jgi:hypothetical protein
MTPLWDCLAHYWRLPERDAQHFWQALWRSHYSQPVEWRRAVVYFDEGDAVPGWDSRAGHGLDQVQAFITTVCPPPRVMTVLEALVHERLLRRAEASRLEECVLRQVDAQGAWR